MCREMIGEVVFNLAYLVRCSLSVSYTLLKLLPQLSPSPLPSASAAPIRLRWPGVLRVGGPSFRLVNDPDSLASSTDPRLGCTH